MFIKQKFYKHNMAKKSMLQRELKRKFLVEKYAEKRLILKNKLKNATSLEERFEISEQLQKLPANSAKVRMRNRCWKTGRPRGYSRFFGLCRNVVREMADDALLPGVTKSSW
jgi:small subunit ribosomal protein S14